MRAELLDIDWDEQLRAFHSQRGRRDESMPHLSTLVNRAMARRFPARFGSYLDGPPDAALAHQGFVWEDVLSGVFSKIYGRDARQMVAERDGILGTLDGFRLGASTIHGIPDAPNGRVLEAKFSKMSAAHRIDSSHFQHWMMRTSGYCTMMGTDEAEFAIMHVNGSYELGGGRFGMTIPRAWRVIFSPYERKENWDQVLREREVWEKERRNGRRR